MATKLPTVYVIHPCANRNTATESWNRTKHHNCSSSNNIFSHVCWLGARCTESRHQPSSVGLFQLDTERCCARKYNYAVTREDINPALEFAYRDGLLVLFRSAVNVTFKDSEVPSHCDKQGPRSKKISTCTLVNGSGEKNGFNIWRLIPEKTFFVFSSHHETRVIRS